MLDSQLFKTGHFTQNACVGVDAGRSVKLDLVCKLGERECITIPVTIMKSIRQKHLWSFISIFVTFTVFVSVASGSAYLHRHRVAFEASPLGNFLGILGAVAFVISVTTALIGVVMERASAISVLALILGLFSFLFYVR